MTTAEVLYLQYQVLPPKIKAELKTLIFESDESDTSQVSQQAKLSDKKDK